MLYINRVLFTFGLLYDLALPATLIGSVVRSYELSHTWYRWALEGYAQLFFLPYNFLVSRLGINPSSLTVPLIPLYLALPEYGLAVLLHRRDAKKQAKVLAALAAINVIIFIIVNTLWAV